MRIRLTIAGKSPCHLCRANCCRQIGHEYAVLLRPQEYARFGPFSLAVTMDRAGVPAGERVLPYVDGKCQFLGDDLRCTIYEDRPQSCRDFECINSFNSEGPGQHGRFLRLNPDVREMLERL